MHSDFLQDLAVVMLVAGVVTLIFHRLKQPVVLGYILAGLIIGPYTPPFPLIKDRHTIEMMSELGVILLMFGLGLHFSLRKLASVGMTAIAGAAMEIIVMFLAGYGTAKFFGWSTMDGIFVGAMLSMSSTTIIIKALEELGLSKARFAGLVFGILIVEDIVAIAILALLTGLASTGTVQVGEIALTLGRLCIFMAGVLVLGLLFVPPLIRYVDKFRSNEMLLLVSLGLCFGVSLVALRFGYSVALGAFLIGAVVAETREHGKIDTLVAPVRDMFAAVFFTAIGMMIDPMMVGKYIWPILALTAVVVIGKVVASGLGTFAAGNDGRTSLRVGMSLAQIGEFSFIIAALGLSLKMTSDFIYPIAVAVSAITTLLTPYLIRGSDPLADRAARIAPQWLMRFMGIYNQWASGAGRASAPTPQIRRLMLRWTLQLGLNVTLISGILILAAWAGQTDGVRQLKVPAWTGGPDTVVWLGGTLVALPLLLATLRKLRAICMTVAEMKVSAARAGKATVAIRAVVTNVLLSVGVLALLLWMLLLTSAILPPWPVLVTLFLLITVMAGLMWGSFIRVYAKAQIQLSETFSTPLSEPLPELSATALPILAGAELRAIAITGDSPSAGKLIRELQVRSVTGASVVGIDRAEGPIVNPGPDEELRAGDRVLILGTLAQLATAESALAGSPAAAAH